MSKAIVMDVFRNDNNEIYDGDITSKEILVWILAQESYNQIDNCYINTIGNMIDRVGVKNAQSIKDLYQSFHLLVEKGYIEWLNPSEKMNKNTILKLRIPEYEDNFTMLSFELVGKILSADELNYSQKTNCLMMTLAIESYRNSEVNYSFPSYEVLMDNTQIQSTTTITNNLNILERIGVLVYGNCGVYYSSRGLINSNNYYVLCDKEDYVAELDNAISKRANELEIVDYDRNRRKGNENRSKTARMNNLHKNFDNLTSTEKQELELLELDYYTRKVKNRIEKGLGLEEGILDKFKIIDVKEVLVSELTNEKVSNTAEDKEVVEVVEEELEEELEVLEEELEDELEEISKEEIEEILEEEELDNNLIEDKIEEINSKVDNILDNFNSMEELFKNSKNNIDKKEEEKTIIEEEDKESIADNYAIVGLFKDIEHDNFAELPKIEKKEDMIDYYVFKN